MSPGLGFLLLWALTRVSAFCPSQCTCIYHGRSDGTGTRSVLCNDPDMSDIPVNVPVDTVKLRVEKTVVRRIPTEAFYYLVDLRYLWITYNSISTVDSSSFYNLKVLHELRLDGNLLSTFPWEAMQEMPSLRTLDLHNNRLSTIPAEAGRYLRNITYLDISSNKLTTLPSDLMDIWPPFSGIVNTNLGLLPQRVILGLQDNPWFCDCRISKLIELSKIYEASVVLLDPLLACSGPENLSGVLFQKAELEQCLKPSVMTSATKITSPLGSNVLLRCDATGYPTPILIWTRSDGSPVNNTVVQESPGEGIRWSIISLNGILYKDAGEYRCKAKNLAGTSEASITLTVVGVVTTTASPMKFTKRPGTEPSNVMQVKTELPTERITMASPTTFTAATLSELLNRKLSVNAPSKPSAEAKRPVKEQPAVTNRRVQQETGGKKEAEASNNTTLSAAIQKVTIKNVQVVDQTERSAVLTWKAPDSPVGIALNVVYSTYGEKDKQTITTDIGKSAVFINGLTPSTKYTACVSPKGTQPRKDHCVVFTTLEEAAASSQAQLLIIGSGIACAVALPLIILLLYKVLKLYCKKGNSADEDLAKETYVKFETLSLKQRTIGATGDLWARRSTAESERMLLCSRSSIDSQMTFKSDMSRPEYLC
ncbi:leucine-rich repeat, immunoglobulin-like domain and transmembrane domain-containing protein 3b [Erpetoichthys calabaricus]|uniref:leucine-rich repeat, immunoglobulin-like domain and transmembrane domain-containing protein 3b n=1 Tax=Erpetoichthys calabaricus TaxID=27687 RepID=UPI00109F295E|nr:leucine-rich repeat, immunoglobulin-like domain and transmembrane domain-containing protein 3b [Erpetoichthys calabaricus]